MEANIEINEAQIAAWESTDCDFSVLRTEFEGKWDDLEDEHNEMVAAIADWKNDDFELENAVD